MNAHPLYGSHKRCSRCGLTLPVSAFIPRSGKHKHLLGSCCRDCRKVLKSAWHQQHKDRENAKTREYRARHREAVRQLARRHYKANREKYLAYSQAYSASHADRNRAHAAVRNAIQSGRLVRGPCEVCGSIEGIDGHHEDYSKRLTVRWLCPAHHKMVHAGTLVLASTPQRIGALEMKGA